MIWHIVRFDFSGVDAATRADIEQAIRELDRLEEVAWLRLAHDLAEPDVTGLLAVFADRAALDAYRVHPDHVPVVERLREAGVGATRLDVETPDDPAELP